MLVPKGATRLEAMTAILVAIEHLKALYKWNNLNDPKAQADLRATVVFLSLFAPFFMWLAEFRLNLVCFVGAGCLASAL